jgi:peptidoglycan/xylan/chitin deacetylase (PgdA/CDA1 family)
MRDRLPILTFHVIGSGAAPVYFPEPQFRHLIARLHAKGYRTLRLSEAAELLRRQRPIPRHSLVLTFDDGDLSVYEKAWPVLQDHGMTATVFILPDRGTFEGRALMSRRQAGQMHGAGIDFGSHTLTHRDLTRLASDQIESEVRQSRAVVEAILQAEVRCFAYPYGRYNQQCVEVVRRHFACACSDRLGLANGRNDIHALARVDAYYLRDPRWQGLIFSEWFPWYLKARALPRRLRRMVLSNP